MRNNNNHKPLVLYFISLIVLFLCSINNVNGGGNEGFVKKNQRWSLFETEFGDVSVVNVSVGRAPVTGVEKLYHVQFFTLEPNALFLPVLLHSDMVFYVHSGSGSLSWVDHEEDMNKIDLKRGDVFRLQPGSVFSLQSNLDNERQKLRVYAIFSNTDEGTYEPLIGAYSSVGDLVRGFNRKVLQSAFQVPEEVIEALKDASRPPQIVHAIEQKDKKKKKSLLWEMESRFLKVIISDNGDSMEAINKKKKKKKEKTARTYNILDEKPDFKNCNGWSSTVNQRDLKSLSGSSMGVFMVNLTNGSMMGPHWNPAATEIAIVLQGQGMIRVVCPIIGEKSNTEKESGCKSMRFRVKEGDVFAVPRFHPMVQISFNNDSFVFMGFSTTKKENYPQFLAGAKSVFRTLDKEVLALSFGVSNKTVDQLLTMQKEPVILKCTSCAEEEQRVMKEEKARKKEEEEERERREREERERAEKERQRKREEEEQRRREEEERKRQEEEEQKKREEEERKRQEEEEREREEAVARKEEEEERKRREKEEREKEEKEAHEREEEEEDERERQEKEAREQEEEKEAERERRKEEEAEAREEEERRERQRQKEEEAAAREEEERRERQRQKEEEAAAREAEERRERQQREQKEAEKERRREKEKEREPEEPKSEDEPAEEPEPEDEPVEEPVPKRRIIKVKFV